MCAEVTTQTVDALLKEANELLEQDSDRGAALAAVIETQAEQIGYLRGRVRAGYTRACVARQQDRYGDALAILESCLALSQEHGDRALEGKTCIHLGLVRERMGETARDLEFQLRAVELLQPTWDQHTLTEALVNVGNCYSNLGDLATAITYFQEAVEISERADIPFGAAMSLRSAAHVLQRLGELDRALEYAERALLATRRISHASLTAEIYRVLADILTDLGRLPEAEDCYGQSYRLALRLNMPFDISASLLGIVRISCEKRDHDSALHACVQALERARAARYRPYEISAMLWMGRILCVQHRPDEAKTYLAQALALAEATGAKSYTIECHKELSEILQDESDFAGALHHHRRLHDLEKEAYGQEARSKMVAMTIKLQTERAEREAAAERVRREQLETAQTELQAAYAEKTALLARLQDQAERDRRIVAVLQETILPTIPAALVPGLRVAIAYQSASDEAAVGGDFYDVFPLGGGKAALVVGDVVGHGLQAALSIAEVRFALRSFLSGSASPDPALALGHLNRFMIESNNLWRPQPAGAEQRHRNAMVALTLAILDPSTGSLRLSAAGMDPVLIIRAATGVAEAVDAADLMLGVSPAVDYPVAEVTLAPGDILAITTDGITEARTRGGKEQFGLERLGNAIINALGGNPPEHADLGQVGVEVTREARDFADGLFKDDVCVLLARPTGTSTPMRGKM